MMKELYRRDLGGEAISWIAHVLTPDLKREDLDSHLVIPYYGDICTALEGFEIWAVILIKDYAYNRLLLMWTSIFSKSETYLQQ